MISSIYCGTDIKDGNVLRKGRDVLSNAWGWRQISLMDTDPRLGHCSIRHVYHSDDGRFMAQHVKKASVAMITNALYELFSFKRNELANYKRIHKKHSVHYVGSSSNIRHGKKHSLSCPRGCNVRQWQQEVMPPPPPLAPDQLQTRRSVLKMKFCSWPRSHWMVQVQKTSMRCKLNRTLGSVNSGQVVELRVQSRHDKAALNCTLML